MRLGEMTSHSRVSTGSGTQRGSVAVALTFAAIMLTATNLRVPLTSVSVLLDNIQTDLSLGHASAGALNAIPSFCMGIFALMGAQLARTLGLERAIGASIGLIGLASMVRATSEVWALFLGTLLIGIGIAFAQSLTPALIKQNFPTRAPEMNGYFTAAMHAGAALGAATSVPLASGLGGWEAALGVWSLPALAATLLWLPWLWSRNQTVAPSQHLSLPWRDPMAWRITAFFSLSSCVYFSAITWIAPLFNELDYAPQSAGLLLSVLTGTQIIGSLIIPRLAQRRRDRRPWLIFSMVMQGSGALGLALIPALGSWLWVVLMGIGLGGMFPLILTLPLDYTRDAYAAGRMNAMMFGVGMTIAGGSPYLAGLLRDLSQGFTIPFLALTALVVALAPIASGFRPSKAVAG